MIFDIVVSAGCGDDYYIFFARWIDEVDGR